MEELSIIGKSVPRVDALDKVTGRAKYTVDVELSRMLHAKVLRSKYPHARILSIDTSEAEKLPGVKAVMTAEDTPKQKLEVVHRMIADDYVLATDKVRYVGEEVAAVAAEDELIAEEALKLIKVEYEELPAVFDPEEAMKPGAPKINDTEGNIAYELETEHGDVAKGFREADYIFEDRFSTQYVHPGNMEPTVCIASYDGSGKLTFYDNSGDPFRHLQMITKALDVTPGKVKIVQKFIGGVFGRGQGDISPYAITAILAKKTGRPVRLVHTREEEFIVNRPRSPWITYLKTGVKKDGTLTARSIRVVATAGACSGYGPLMITTGLAKSIGSYTCPNLRLEGKCVYTNTIPTGQYRSFGGQEPQFAQESLMDMIAEGLGMDPIKLRLKNATRAGDVTVLGQKIGSCGLQECSETVAEYVGWEAKRAKKQPYLGIGTAWGMSTTDSKVGGFGGSTAYVKVLEDARVNIISGEHEWGQGSHTILSQIVGEELGVPLEAVDFSEMDSDVCPYTLGPYGGGPVTHRAGHAVSLAAMDAKRQLFTVAAKMLEARFEDLEMKNQEIFVTGAPRKAVSLATVASYARYSGAEVIGKGVYAPHTENIDSKTLYGNTCSSYTFAAQVAEVEIDPETGRVKVLKFANAMDVGRAINPMACEAQSEGGIVQEIGNVLMEDFMYEQGTVVNPNFADYKVPTATNIPPIKTFLVETNEPNGPYGAKACGMLTITPTAAALANAIYDAAGVRIKDLPITPMKVLKALEEKRRPDRVVPVEQGRSERWH